VFRVETGGVRAPVTFLKTRFVQVADHVKKVFAARKSPNKLKIEMGHGGKPWVSDFDHPHYIAGRKAMKRGDRFAQVRNHLQYFFGPFLVTDFYVFLK